MLESLGGGIRKGWSWLMQRTEVEWLAWSCSCLGIGSALTREINAWGARALASFIEAQRALCLQASGTARCLAYCGWGRQVTEGRLEHHIQLASSCCMLPLAVKDPTRSSWLAPWGSPRAAVVPAGEKKSTTALRAGTLTAKYACLGSKPDCIASLFPPPLAPPLP